MSRSHPRAMQLARWLLMASFILPQATCGISAPPGSTLVLDPDVAAIIADLIRDIVFLNNVYDDFFDDFDDDHFFF